MTEVFLLLDKSLLKRGVDAGVLIQEAGKKEESDLASIRKIIDCRLGFLSLVQDGRKGPVRSDVVRLDTPIPIGKLPAIPGVEKKSCSLLALRF